ncbi:MAG TPA: heparin lyase I family protein [Polyangia bacterium]|nr:heparin lyase I family protein [Polyangia bacterium]
MRNFVRSCSVLVALFGPLSVAGTARGAVVWTSTFEKGDLSEWSPGVNATKGTRQNVEVLGEQVHSGKFACKITVHPDDTFGGGQDRVDIQHRSTLSGANQDTWLSGYYMMPADAGVRNEFAFWESNSSYVNMNDFWVEPKTGGGTTIGFGVGRGNLGATKLWMADFSIGKWHQVAMHVHWSTDPTKGIIDVWFDGQQVVTNYKTQTAADANTLFFQTGLHRRSVANFTDTIYFDDFTEADALADAQIGAPTPGDGGAPLDAASADGSADATGAAGGGGTTGALDAGATGAAGAGATGAAGAGEAGATGVAGSTTGAAGAATAGAGGTGAAGRGSASGGCASASGAGEPSGLGLVSILALLAAVGVTGRPRR